MPTPATEIAVLPLQPGTQVEDPSSEAGKLWKSFGDSILSQEGVQRFYWGRQVESPDTVLLLVDWDSLESHQKFINSPEYGPFVGSLGTLLASPPSLHHAHFNPHPPAQAVSGTHAPVTELVTFFLPADVSDADKASFETARNNLVKLVEKREGGRGGIASGWVVEKIDNPTTGAKSTAFTAAIGWESVEAHTKFRETEAFKEVIGPVRAKVTGAQMRHVKFNEV